MLPGRVHNHPSPPIFFLYMTASTPLLRSYIGGQWTASQSDEWLDDINPSNRSDIVAKVPHGTADDVSAAVRAAREALEAWRHTTGPARADLLYRWSQA